MNFGMIFSIIPLNLLLKNIYEEEIPSWTVERQKNIRAFRKAYFLDKAVHLPNYLLIKLLGANKYNYLKHIFKK